MNDDLGDVEYAQTTTGRSTDFPKIWGRPAGTQWSEERADWIKAQIGRFRGLSAIQELDRRDTRYLGMLRRAVVASRRTRRS